MGNSESAVLKNERMQMSAKLPDEITVPPYGPTQGMIQGLDLLRRTEPSTVNIDFLKNNRIAPGNEYKVVGALRFLGLIDEAGAPTEKARLIKARGVTFTENLRSIIQAAYPELFSSINISTAEPDDIYNYFILKARLKPEMARKAARFFAQLCQLAELQLSAENKPPESKKIASTNLFRGPKRDGSKSNGQQMVLNITLAVDPVVARMDEEELSALLKKIVKVAKVVSAEERFLGES